MPAARNPYSDGDGFFRGQLKASAATQRSLEEQEIPSRQGDAVCPALGVLVADLDLSAYHRLDADQLPAVSAEPRQQFLALRILQIGLDVRLGRRLLGLEDQEASGLEAIEQRGELGAVLEGLVTHGGSLVGVSCQAFSKVGTEAIGNS